MKPLTRRQVQIAALYIGAGSLCLTLAIANGSSPDWPTWGLFAIAFVILELNAVEVNDRMIQSSGIMVMLTAGTVFALDESSSATVAMILLGLVGPLTTNDIRERRWFQPLANMGQLMVAAGAAGLILDFTLSGVPETPSALAAVAIGGVFASLVYSIINLTMVRVAVKRVYGARNLLPWSGLHVLFSSQVVMGLIGGLLGAALQIVGRESVIVLILFVYVLANLSLTSYSQLREAHQSAIRGFVKVLEARDMYTRGHTERVAYFSQLIGEELHYTGTQLERLRWAALIHDLGKLAIPGDLLSKLGPLEPEEYEEMRKASKSVEGILAEVDFLKPMVSISGVHYIDLEGFDPESWNLDASIVAAADAFDAMTSTRSYRMAMSQVETLSEMRADTSGRFKPDVIDALSSALDRTGEVYGAAVAVPTESSRLSGV